MIKAFTAYSSEIDDTDITVSDIVSGIGLDNLLKNSIGLLSCHSEFVESEAVSEVCAALPFPVIGTTSINTAVRGSEGNFLLTLLVLTSDDVSFEVNLTESITAPDLSVIKSAYDETLKKLGETPKLIISYAPILVPVSSDFMVDSFSKASGGIPNFGTLACDHTGDYHTSSVIYNGETFTDRYAFALVAGDVSPNFYCASISGDRIFEKKGVVTDSEGNLLRAINNLNVPQYMQSIGMTMSKDSIVQGINSFPFVIDYGDGSDPVVRVPFSVNEQGHAVCAGDIPKDAIISISSIDSEEVMRTSSDALANMRGITDKSAFLIYSCIGRYFGLGDSPHAEIEKTQEELCESAAVYQLTYSGTELCPVYFGSDKSKVINRSHNMTYVVCAL
ncbi:hypothetical protein FACS1894188_04180 [Clostridia bacterium]|nr:hypothetical protein FACS1894188_04180 [Clostridia bacterium]